MTDYPVDEFDNPPADAPVGAHRRPTSKWRPVVPFLVILVVVPLLAWAFSEYLIRDNEASTVDPGPSDVAQSAQSDQQSPEPTTPTPLPTEPVEPEVVEPVTPPEESNVNLSAPVEVVNVAGIDGWGGETAGKLGNEGFTNVVADNLDWSPSPGNSIRYQTAADEATAKRIGEILGISDIALDESASNTHSVTVFLVAP